MNVVRLIGIIGSLRSGSVNASAARASVALVGEGVSLELHDVGALPLFHGDEEEAGPPEPVTTLQESVRAADGVVLFSPEYNSSLPAVTKNVIDWLSRDPSCWDGTGVTMVSMSPGGRAGAGAREHFEAIMPRQATRLFPTTGFGNYADLLDSNGTLVDQDTLDALEAFLAEFAEFCLASPG